jgi:hypothetical protein
MNSFFMAFSLGAMKVKHIPCRIFQGIGGKLGLVRLSYKSFFFCQVGVFFLIINHRTVFFSYDFLDNQTGFSSQQIWQTSRSSLG